VHINEKRTHWHNFKKTERKLGRTAHMFKLSLAWQQFPMCRRPENKCVILCVLFLFFAVIRGKSLWLLFPLFQPHEWHFMSSIFYGRMLSFILRRDPQIFEISRSPLRVSCSRFHAEAPQVCSFCELHHCLHELTSFLCLRNKLKSLCWKY
jgi:hypothetical protein